MSFVENTAFNISSVETDYNVVESEKSEHSQNSKLIITYDIFVYVCIGGKENA